MKALRCHRCGSADLALTEVIHEHARYEGLYLDGDGSIRAGGEGIFTAGDVQPALTQIECQGCGHAWHPRRPFAGGA